MRALAIAAVLLLAGCGVSENEAEEIASIVAHDAIIDSDEVRQLKSEVSDLESRIADLESRVDDAGVP